MVAYSFKQRFVAQIQAGTKRQTIRADRKRHARPGEQLQLYRGMRTRQCELIGRAECIEVVKITILFDDADDEAEGFVLPGFGFPGGLEGFAIADGFASWVDLKQFWRENHPGIDEFQGNLIMWGDLV
ncbi:MAG: hypothetical protein E5Y10_21920 [Mesorhizobium sp.]|uniref:ASCH domain-containing protein n=1 Tax=Mesorhizobium sp. TaxID=1871066 RepID=UPI00121CB68A|nr:ASCH domain-containing protein [Mesorhizobium sp.]TIN36790.1 MAG: hypothetical protein E5Y13_22530 [Mesorhizobium sp.]TJU86635.1 MAG: hypothetical protein E5Y10_21920 [Mesorhizobium sp.]